VDGAPAVEAQLRADLPKTDVTSFQRATETSLTIVCPARG
jgi:hypothetical protein